MNIVDFPIVLWNVTIYDRLKKKTEKELFTKDVLHLQTMDESNFPILKEPGGDYFVLRIRSLLKFSDT